MLSHSWLKLAAAFLALLLFVAFLNAWRADRRDRAQLTAELAATKQLLTAADARQHDRDTQLAQTLAKLAAEKRTVVMPAQIVRELPKKLPLPAPITLQVDLARSSVGAGLAPPERVSPPAAAGDPRVAPTEGALDGAFIPRADLKPLYDFALDCQACQAKLSAAQSDLADEKAKTAALTRERDDAVRLAKGGTAWRRITRATKWFLLGAAAGAVAAKQ